jgi:molybdenum cofactor cytidylyltransferase
MYFALIPAAGKSTRMGRPKLALPLGECSVLEHVVTAVRQAGVGRILVVIGPHTPGLVALAERAGASALVLPEETADMRTTVERGLSWIEERFHPQPDDAWLLLPADHPTIDGSIMQDLLQAARAHPDRSIIIPVHDGRRGHPTFVGWKHVEGIRALPAGAGLNRYFREHAGETLELPTANAEVVCDLDTPEDYERLVRKFAARGH